MAWLELFGWDIGAKSADESNVNIGSFGRGFDGSFFDARRAKKGAHKFSTAPMVEADAQTLFNLILGLGETWTFDDGTDEEYGSRGSGIAVGSTWTRQTATPKWGLGYISVLSGNYFEPNYSLPSSWTILHYKHDGTSWTAYALLDSGDYWDGTAKNSGFNAANWIDTSTTGKPRFLGKNESGALANTLYDHVVILPYRASDNFIKAYASMAVAPLGGLPFLTASGDYFDSTRTISKKVFGTSVNKKPIRSNVGGSFNHVGRVVDFGFEE